MKFSGADVLLIIFGGVLIFLGLITKFDWTFLNNLWLLYCGLALIVIASIDAFGNH